MRQQLRAAALCLLLGASPWAQAQKMTEIYIPIGQSPGLSGQTLIGEIVGRNAAAGTLDVRGPAGVQTVNVSDSTEVYLDRSKSRLRNLRGSLQDCTAGRRVEVKFADAQTRRVVDWIKVEVADAADQSG